MRILISADIEGVSGIVNPEQTKAGSIEYEKARILLTEEVNACVNGAISGGATDIVVVDAHGTYRNILFDKLHKEAKLICGKPRLFGMMTGLEECGSFDAAILLGYHARAGSYGVLSHTINGRAFLSISIDGKAVGEILLNSALAGEHNVPIALVSGDNYVAKECAFLNQAEIITTKQALSTHAAMNLPCEIVHEALENGAEIAVSKIKELKTYKLESDDLWVEVMTCHNVFADIFSQLEDVERIYPNGVAFSAKNIKSIIRKLNILSALASTV